MIRLFCYGGFIFGSGIANTFPAVPLLNLIKPTKQAHKLDTDIKSDFQNSLQNADIDFRHS